MSDLPRGSSGRKGGKLPRRKAVKQRKVIEEENRHDITPYNEGDHLVESPLPPENNISQAQQNISWDFTPSLYNQEYYYGPSYNPYDPYGYYRPTAYAAQSFMGVSNQQDYVSASSPATSLPLPSYIQENLFYVTLLTGRIKVCAGCRGPHLKNAQGYVLPSPNNLCIAHKENRTYVNPNTGLECSKLGNSYYHVNRACLIKKHPQFKPSQVVCSDNVTLDEAQKSLLQATLGFTTL
jgi:hypothetical protein